MAPGSLSAAERLTETVERFCRFIEGLPEAARREAAWGPKEVLAHLVLHHERYLAQAAARAAGESYEPPAGRFRDWNLQAVDESRGVRTVELVARFREANRALVALHDACDPTSLVLEIKKGAQPRALAGLLLEVEAHIRNHHRRLAREVGRISLD